MTTATEQIQSDILPTIYALIWRSAKSDEEYDQEEFNSRIPRLMAWLRELHAAGKLVACGGGGFENHVGGLTLVRADTIEDAIEMSLQNPMNEIGTTELLAWDVFYGTMDITTRENLLQ